MIAPSLQQMPVPGARNPLLDVPAEPLPSGGPMSFLALLCCILLIAISATLAFFFLDPIRAGQIVPVFACGSSLGVFLFVNRARRKALEATFRKGPADPREFLDFCILHMRQVGTDRALPAVGKQLVRNGWLGWTVRIAQPPHLKPVEPLPFAIEPLSLTESDPIFQQIAEGLAPDPLAHAEARRKQSRVALLRWIAISAFVALMATRPLIKSWQTGSLDSGLFRAMLVGLVAWLLLHRGGLVLSNRVLAVNGGLLLRLPRLRGTSKLHLFQRNSSILIMSRLNSGHWLYTVHDPGHATGIAFSITDGAATMLLRAWLSPVPSPGIERLSDFA